MGIRVSGLQGIERYIKTEVDKVVEAFVDDLKYLGEESVKFVKDRSGVESWYDQTGNLRSSIGYVISKDGAVIGKSDFDVVKNGTEGSREGSSYADSLASQYPTGYALIIVAGMNYAAIVEAIESKDVLASAELFLRDRLVELINEYNEDFA